MTDNIQVSDDILRRLWITRLPSEVKTVLLVAPDMTLDNLAKLAAKIMEDMRTGKVAAVSSVTPIADISDQLRQVTMELKQ